MLQTSISSGASYAQERIRMLDKLRGVICLCFVFVLITALEGCSVVDVAAGYVVNEYCSTPQPARIAVRATVDQAASPHRVRVFCHRDFQEIKRPSLK